MSTYILFTLNISNFQNPAAPTCRNVVQNLTQNQHFFPILQVHNILQQTYLRTYLLTQWSRILLVKLNGFQLIKKFPAVDGKR